MKSRIVSVILSVILLVALVGFAFAEGEVPKDEKKQTSLGKYATAMETYNMWKADPEKVFIIDTRTPQEYVYVGHPAMALNIPILVWTGKFDGEKKDVVLEKNPDFVAEIQKRFKPEDKIMMMCRSGQRSATAAEQMIKAGFKNVYSVTDGFEGDKVNDTSKPNHGKRTLNGWKNSQAPWTYDLDIKLMPSLPAK